MYEEESRERYAARDMLEPFLAPGEEVLWTGRPYASVSYRAHPLTVIFPLFFLGFSVFWMAMAFLGGGGFFALFGLPFFGIGLGLVWVALFGPRHRIKNTIYAVTDRRAIILYKNRRGTDCTEYPFSRMASLSVTGVQGTSGSIQFREPVDVYRERTPYSRRTTVNYSAATEWSGSFLMIDNVQSVYHMISEHLSGA